MAKKFGVFIFIVFISIGLASVYGLLHNLVSFSISNEYFSKYKFEQFGFWDYAFENDDIKKVAFIGILATWWFGLFIGVINGSFGLLQSNYKIMWKSTIGAITRILLITIGFGIFGILIGRLIVSNININWNLPAGLLDRSRFLTSATMHNFSYFGGMIGLFFGIKHQLKIKNASAQQRINANAHKVRVKEKKI